MHGAPDFRLRVPADTQQKRTEKTPSAREGVRFGPSRLAAAVVAAMERARFPRRREIAAAAHLFLRARLIDRERAAVEVGAVHLFGGELALIRRAKGYEGKSARATGIPVGREMHVRYGPELAEGVTETAFGRVEGQVSDVEFVTHVVVVFVCFVRCQRVPGDRVSNHHLNLKLIEDSPTTVI